MYEGGRRASAVDLLTHPPAAFLRNYILRGGFADGVAGLTISLVNAYSVLLKFAKLWELQTANSRFPTPDFPKMIAGRTRPCVGSRRLEVGS